MAHPSSAVCVACALATAAFFSIPALASGDLDPAFGTGGKAVVDMGGANEHATAIVGDSGGNLFLAGGTNAVGSSDFAILKLAANGHPAAGFGNGGKLVIDAGGIDGANAIALDAAGNLLVAGGSGASGAGEMTLLKLDPGGNLVAGFASSGKYTLDLGGFETAVAVVPDAAGNLYLVGESSTASGAAIVVKLDAGGHPVAAYGNAGVATVNLGAEVVNAAVLDSAGRLLVSGSDSFGPFGGGQITVTKIDAAGNQIASFGSGGVAQVYIDAGSATTTTTAAGLALDAAGNVFLGGWTDAAGNFTNDFVAAKLDANGALAADFGNGGVALVDTPNSEDIATGIALDRAGDVYIAGASTTDGRTDFAVVELDSTGNRVAEFGELGFKFIDFGDDAFAYGIALTVDGRLCLAGSANAGTSSDFAAAALRVDSFDAIFANGFD